MKNQYYKMNENEVICFQFNDNDRNYYNGFNLISFSILPIENIENISINIEDFINREKAINLISRWNFHYISRNNVSKNHDKISHAIMAQINLGRSIIAQLRKEIADEANQLLREQKMKEKMFRNNVYAMPIDDSITFVSTNSIVEAINEYFDNSNYSDYNDYHGNYDF